MTIYSRSMITIKRLIFNPIQENTYVVWDQTGECVIIDAGNSSPHEDRALEQLIESNNLKPVAVVNTHGHFDHTLGAAYATKRFNIPFVISRKDEFLIENAATSGSIFGVSTGPMPRIDTDIDTLAEVRFGQTALKVIAVPGHTPGHIALYEPESKSLFTGDTLFRESIGRTDLPGGDYSWIMRSILDKIVPLGDDVKVYPGHGEETDIGHETLYNPFIVEVLANEVRYE